MISETLQKAREFEAQYGPHIPDRERPAFHATPTIGWMNDPNGFSFYKGECHLFYQYHPYSNEWGPMHWGHLKTRDFLCWERLPIALAPDQDYDSAGCFSGGAVELPDGRQLLMYTGVRRGHNADGYLQDIQTQCLAIGDGLNYEKLRDNPVLDGESLPQGGSTIDFRDPKVWRGPDGTFHAVVGNRTSDGSGAILLYQCIENSKWEFVRTLDASHNQYGKMWECPDFFPLNGKQVLIISPQEMSPIGLEFHAGNGTVCLIGEYSPDGGFARQNIQAIDYGLDFYAPQTVETPDGRRIMIAWMQNWDTVNAKPYNCRWFGQMALPRELSVKNGRLIQNPVRELEAYWSQRVAHQNIPVSGEINLTGIQGRVLDMTVTIRPTGPDLYRWFRIRVAASFASVLLRPLNRMGFFVHLCGKENTAKSAAVWLAASIWADPKKTAPYVRSFDGTINGTEGFAHFLQSLPVCLDETTTNRDQVKFDTFVYKMLQGMDKTRGTKDGSFRKHKSWACTFLSTGENPIQNENSNGGSMVRVLSLSTGSKPLFGDYAPTIYREVSQHAGWIGRKFVERVLCPEHLEEADDLLKQFIAEFKALGYEGKQADAAAVCLAADTLASQYVFEDSDDSLRLKVEDFLPYIITPAESDVGMRTAQWLKEFVFVNKERFIDMAGVRPFGECWGKFMPGGYVAIIRSVLSKQMEKAGLATGAKRFAEWADENGLLQRSKSDSSYFKSVDFKGSTQRSLVINIDAIDPVPEDELPFPDEADEAEQKSEDAPQTALPEFQSDDIVQLSA